MWRRNAVAVLLLVCRLTSSGSAYEREPTSLLSKQKWVCFDVVRGRVTATHVRGGQGRQSRESEAGSTRELLAVNVHGVYPSIRYERTDPHRTARPISRPKRPCPVDRIPTRRRAWTKWAPAIECRPNIGLNFPGTNDKVASASLS